MNTERLKAIFLIAAFSFLTSTLTATPQLQQSHVSNTDAIRSHTQTAAYQNGYQDGWVEGESAWSNSHGPSLNRSGNYSKADRGYIQSLGDKNEYKESYRRGFEEGYSVGYGRPVVQHKKRSE
jgi:flagellar biosynthesis/type III secretory pathway protein FliH